MSDSVTLPSDKKFGIFFTIIFFLGSIYLNHLEHAFMRNTFIALFFISGLVSIIKPSLLRPFNMGWMKLGLLLGRIVNPIVLGLLFFGLFTPLAILMRLFGRDELRLKKKRNTTHWLEEEKKSDFRDQF